MANKPPVRWFRFFTLPLFVVAVSTTIAAAQRSSSDLMFIAAGMSAIGVVSLLVGRFLINHPDVPRAIVKTMSTNGDDSHEEHKQHAIAHH